MSHDIEDIINVIDGRPEIINEIESGAESLRGRFHLNALEQQRVVPLIERLRQIAGI
jgi:hypothetical protein